MIRKHLAASAALLFLLSAAIPAFAQTVPRITKEDLKARLDKIVLLDARRGYDWKASGYKIKGAVREEDLAAFAQTHPDKTTPIVVYCA